MNSNFCVSCCFNSLTLAMQKVMTYASNLMKGELGRGTKQAVYRATCTYWAGSGGPEAPAELHLPQKRCRRGFMVQAWSVP